MAVRGIGRTRTRARRATEVAPALESANWTVLNADGTHIVTFSAGTMRYQSDTTSPVLTVQKTGVLNVGYAYEVTATTSAYTSGSLKIDTIGPNVVISAGAGTVTISGVATSTAINITRNSASVDLTLSSISIKQILLP